MPIYEYECGSCQHEFEALQKISDQPLKDCPNCGEPALTKKVSAAAFRLSGSGWYETDFKSGNKKNLAGNTSEGSDSAKSDKGDKASNKTKSDLANSSKTASQSSASKASSGSTTSGKQAS